MKYEGKLEEKETVLQDLKESGRYPLRHIWELMILHNDMNDS